MKSSNEKYTPRSCLNSKCPYTKVVKIDNVTQYPEDAPIPATAVTTCECPVSKLRNNLDTESANCHQKVVLGMSCVQLLASTSLDIFGEKLDQA